MDGHTYFTRAIEKVETRSREALIDNIETQLTGPSRVRRDNTFEQRQLDNFCDEKPDLQPQTEDFPLMRQYNNGYVAARDVAEYIVDTHLHARDAE